LGRRLGVDDIVFGRDQVSYIAPDGSLRAIAPVNATHVPFNCVNGVVENLVDGTPKLNVYPLNLVVGQTINYGQDAGTPNAYSITLNATISGYVAGQQFTFRAINANTGAATLNVNNLGAKPIKLYRSGSLADLISGDILAGQVVTVIYDGTQFIMTSPSANTVSPQNLVQASDVQKQTYTYWHNTSSTDSYIINPTPPVSSYTDGQRWYIYTSVGNTGACSLSVSGLASVPIKKMDPWGNLVDLDTGDIFANGIFVVVYSSAASCFILVAPTRSREFPVNSCYIAQANPQTLINYGTWSYVQPLYLGLFHFENNLKHHAYNGYYNYLSAAGSFVTSPVKFGTYSLSVPDASAGSYTNTYTPPRTELQFGLQIDMWIQFSFATYINAYLWGDSSCINWRIVSDTSSTKIALYDTTTQLLLSAALKAGVWHHTAMASWGDSNGHYVSMWVDGARVGTVQTLTSTSVAFDRSNQIITRTDTDTGHYLYIDELRIIDSTPTYGDTYTVPTAAYTPNGPPPYLWTRTA
jgi:hypothetical protein